MIGFKKSPDAVTVTATVTLIVADVDVRPFTVLSPAVFRVRPDDMSKKIGV
jgi:hypothetical protein